MKKTVYRLIALLLVLCTLPVSAFAEKVSTEGYEFPDDWSHDALVFAVENGILAGDENHNLNPQNNITRAEMAAVLVRLLGASETTDLSVYSDVSADAWYYPELSAAVAAGIFGGTSPTTMHPMNPITREQAIVVLSRAFGIVTEDRLLWKEFTDHYHIYDYAKDCMCAMKEIGSAKGYSDGSFKPQGYITRAEVSSLLYNLFDTIADTPDEIPESGFVLYRGAEALPEELSLDGTLIIGQAVEPKFSAGNWNITEGLILRTGTDTDVDLRGLTTKKLVCAPQSGNVVGKAESVWLWGAGGRFEGDAEKVYCVDNTQAANGDFGYVEVRAGKLSLDGQIGEIRMMGDTQLTFYGEAESAVFDGMNGKIDGPGFVKTIYRNRANCTFNVGFDTVNEDAYNAYYKEHDNALSTVQTQRVPCTVLKDTSLYSDQYLTGYVCDVPKGTTVYNEFHPAGDSFMVTYTDADGKARQGWLPRWDCYIPDEEIVTWNSELDYSDAVKEGFVNLKQYISRTDYLIWINRYTQRVIIYTGYKGNWKVHKTFLCSTGANNTPTPQGIYEIEAHYGTWYFDYYLVYTATGFYGDTAFHSTLYNFDGSHFDGRLGMPLSHGCIRMQDEDAKYIYDNMPFGTTVVVW